MAATLGQLAAILMEDIVTITVDESYRLINDAYLDIAQEHPWPHLIRRFTLQTEPQYNTGTIAITQDTAAVTLTDGVWSTAWSVAPSMRRMVVEDRSEIFDVTTFGTTLTATLADTYTGEDLTAGSYNLFRDVYPLPTDCGYTKLMALYDPTQRCGDRGRLRFMGQSDFVRERQRNTVITGAPTCFAFMNQTAETPPRPQMQFSPAPDAVYVYQGWYFRRPAVMLLSTDYPDFPAEHEKMLPTKAALNYYATPKHYSQRFITLFANKYADLFRKAKRELNGQDAIEREVLGTKPGGTGFNPRFSGTVTGSVDWSS